MSKDYIEINSGLDRKLQLRHLPFTRAIDSFVLKVGEIFNWLWVILVAVIILNVVLRYVFKSGMIELEELQWHLYCIGWLVGLSSTYIVDQHVRVDVLSDRLKFKTKLWFEFFGILLLFLPFIILVLYYSVPFFELSWTTNERSTSANGLPARWFVKGFLVISFFLLLMAGISRISRVVATLRYGLEKKT
jgi:TRAP-type mannitol/chloroaromatic compound transport system permease small subunit|tara:strand:- start:4651 stop:5220 length:570 start_codon:yes stop_codon:yes gene_type:complete